jgi:putative ABC transport system permease protein
MFGIQLTHPREMALQAARGGVDFTGLFLALGFFIILSALLLMLVPLSEMLFQRKNETTLLHSLGYSTRRIIGIYLRESVVTVVQSSVAGVVAGMIYTWLVLFLLGTVWKGATHTEGLMIHPHVRVIITGLLTGVLLSVSFLWIFLRRSLKNTVRRIKQKPLRLRRKLILTIIASLILLLSILCSLFFVKAVELFIIAGITFIGAAALWGDYMICRESALSNKSLTEKNLIWKTLFAGRKQVILSFFPLAMGVFIVFSVGLNRQGFADNAQIITGTGGYSLWCESSVPVYHNLSTQSGREKLALTELPAGAEVLQMFRYGADDASCLNLNKVSNPTVLGVDMEQLSRSRFKINRIFGRNEADNRFEAFRVRTGSVYPALIDETVLLWGLGLKLGDTIVYQGSCGKHAVLQLAGKLHNSIFQGNILIDRRLFSEIWDDITGSEVMLVKVDDAEKEDVKILVSQALNEYGVRVMTTNDRLKMFNSVTDTYLTIFLMLGSIGMLLGIMSFVIVVRKNLVSRRNEISIYHSLGFPNRKIAKLLQKENILVPVFAIVTGFLGAMFAAGGGITHIGLWIWLTSFAFTILFVVCVLIFVKKVVERIIN